VVDDVVTVALSGADNTGKTKQLGILARRIGPAAVATGPLDVHDARRDVIKKNGMGDWRFQTGTIEEVADVLAASYLHRSGHLGGQAGLQLMDRGIPMLEASVAATVAASLEGGVQAAVEIRRQLLKSTPDLRALFKVTALLAKILLRFEDVECAGDSEAVSLLLHGLDERCPRGGQGEKLRRT